MDLVRYNIKIKVITPFNISAGEYNSGFINKYTVKYRGKPYIPASTIKGKIKNNFYMIANLEHTDKDCNCPMCKIFGKEGYYPSRVFIDDFHTEEKGEIRIKFGNSIDRYRRTNKENALYSEEVVSNKVFTGEMLVYFDKDTIKYKEQLEIAVKMIDAVGNGKSRGSGHVEVEIQEVK